MATNNSDNTNPNSSVTPPGCSGSIPIIPLRYAIMPSHEDNKEQYAYEKSKGNLEKDFVKIKTSHYTLRTTRPGYIYMYEELGKGILRLWEADGDGNYTALQWTSMEDYGKRSNRLETLPYITTKDCPHTVHIAFSNDLWPKSITEKALADANFRNTRMQPLKVGEILDGSGKISAQKHILPVSEIEQFVEEYRIPQDYTTAFSWSTYKPDSVTKPSNIRALAAEYGEAHRIKLPVIFALKDAQGITEDQGNLASLYLHQLTDLKNIVNDKKRKKGTGKPTTKIQLPDVVKLDTRKISNLSADFHRKKTVSNIIEILLKSTYPSKKYNLETMTRLSKETLRNAYGHANVREVGDSEARLHALGNTHVNKGASELLDHVDTKELYKFRQEWDTKQAELNVKKKKVLIVVEDHAKWLKTGESDQKNNANGLAICWSCYNRDNKLSAGMLEKAIVDCMDGMGTPVPGMQKNDKREALLATWIQALNSPLHLAVNAFKPYEEKKDSIGDMFAGANASVEGLMKLFPYTVSTEKIVNIITTYSMRKLPGKTRWNKSRSVISNVDAAIQDSNLKKLLKALHGRYTKVLDTLEKSAKTYLRFINHAITHGEKVQTSVKLNGTRAVRITETTTATTYKTLISGNLLREIAKTPLAGYISYLHAMNLMSAFKNFSRDDNLKNNLELTSAILGAAGAFLETSAIAGAIVNKTRLANTTLVGKAVQNAAFRRLTSTGFLKVLGYAGAVAEASVHLYDGYDLGKDGDNDAAAWSLSAGILLGSGSAITVYGGGLITAALTGAAGSSTVPGIGWVVAGILLIGAGIGALIMKAFKKDTPMQIWVSRTIFGIQRETIFGRKVDKKFTSVANELEGYFVTTYRPLKIGEAPEKTFDYDAETTWHEHGLGKDEAEFTILLPGYVEGVSKWQRSQFTGYDEDDVDSEKDADAATVLEKNSLGNGYKRLKPEGLYINLRHKFKNHSVESASITIDYWPNQAISEQKVSKTFYVDE